VVTDTVLTQRALIRITPSDAAEDVRDFLQGRLATGGEAWQCSECGETSEGQFTACWQCGTARG